MESKMDLSGFHSDSTSDPGASDSQTCCCSHGMRCTCALKKEYLDPVPEADMPVLGPKRTISSRKPRLLKSGSDNILIVFTNGHHKPVHKHNDSAHNCGAPYKIPIPHSVHGNADVARRSTDSLPLIRRKEESHSQLSESISSAKQESRMVRSEHGSPEPRATLGRENGLPLLDIFCPRVNDTTPGQISEDYAHSSRGIDNNYSSQEDFPLLSAGLSNTAIDWSAYNMEPGPLSPAYSQPPSYASFDHSNVGQPGLATSSSSEAGDYISHNRPRSLTRLDLASTAAEDRTSNRLSCSSYTSMPQASALSASNLSNLDDYIPTTASPTEFEERTGGRHMGSEVFAKHGFTVHDAQKLAHPETPTEAMSGLSIPAPADEINPVWAGSFDPRQASFVPDNGIDGDWSR